MSRICVTTYVTRGAVAAALGGLFVAGACASTPDTNRVTYVGPIDGGQLTTAPDYAQYKLGVDPYLGKRCATLDCHGQLGRGLRLFSQTGLRAFDASGPYFPNQTGVQPLTEDEYRANFASVVGLEPEVMAQVIAEGGNNPNKLLLLKKPRLLESHKGGQVMLGQGDDGYRCVTSWIAGTLDQTACANALSVP